MLDTLEPRLDLAAGMARRSSHSRVRRRIVLVRRSRARRSSGAPFILDPIGATMSGERCSAGVARIVGEHGDAPRRRGETGPAIDQWAWVSRASRRRGREVSSASVIRANS